MFCFQVNSQYILCKRKRVPLLTYAESMVVCFEIGPKPLRRLSRGSAMMVDIFIVVYQLGIGCVYFLFIAKNNKMVSFLNTVKLFLVLLITQMYCLFNVLQYITSVHQFQSSLIACVTQKRDLEGNVNVIASFVALRITDTFFYTKSINEILHIKIRN